MIMTMTQPDSSPLSERETEILRLVATGATNHQIANELDISYHTVKVHIRNIYAKVGVSSRTEASMYAVRMGILQLEPPATSAPETARIHDQAAVQSPPAELPSTPAPQPIEAVAVERGPSIEHGSSPADVAVRTSVSRYLWIAGAIGLVVVALLGIAVMRMPSADVEESAAGVAMPVWEERPAVPGMHRGFALATHDGKMYVIGGESVDGVHGTVQRYSPQSRTWTRLSPKPTPVTDVQAGVIGGKVYVAGGRTESGEISAVLEVYDPQTDTWSSAAPLPTPRSRYAVAAVEGKLYLFGGWDGANHQATVWMFDPDMNRWHTCTPMPAARSDMSASVINTQIHLIGGQDEQGAVALHHVYDPSREGGDQHPWQVWPPLPQAVANPASAAVLSTIYAFDSVSATLFTYNVNEESWRSSPVPLASDEDSSLATILMNESLYLFYTESPSAPTSSMFEYEVLYRSQLPIIMKE